MSEPRVIKKYPNRRLYDTVESRYITLADVQRLVIEKVDFVVVDKKTNVEITRSILLQVISEQEHQVEPILSQEFMTHLIRSYGSNLQPAVSGHLEDTMKQFLNHPHHRTKAAGDSGAHRAPAANRSNDGVSEDHVEHAEAG
jgi:polyhydroxyalkanoate synthesis repressor PhaR